MHCMLGRVAVRGLRDTLMHNIIVAAAATHIDYVATKLKTSPRDDRLTHGAKVLP